MIKALLMGLMFITSFSSKASLEGKLIGHKLNEINQALKELHPSYSCQEKMEDDCPDVHVTQWCQKQFDFLKNTKSDNKPQITRAPSSKRILFLGEEHGDEQAYSYYEKLLDNKEAKFDCLFLELPTNFQKNFDAKKGIAHEKGLFENLNKNKNPNELNRIELTDYRYMEHLESLVETAKANKVKVLLVDSSERFKDDPTSKSETMRRNTTMAKNIQEKFGQNKCSNAISIQGNMHLFVKDDKDLKPIDQILKETNTDKDLEIQKAFIYSPGSKNLADAMGPCSWLNYLPEEQESYYSGKRFSEQNKIFPEVLDEALSEKFGAVDENIDYAIFLPLQIDKNYLLKKLNREQKSSIPKKFTSKSEISIEVNNVPMPLRSNSFSLNISNAQDGLVSKCINMCEGRYTMILKDISLDQKEIRCQSYHPSRTGGAPRAPIVSLNQTIKADCYCTK